MHVPKLKIPKNQNFNSKINKQLENKKRHLIKSNNNKSKMMTKKLKTKKLTSLR